MAFDWKGLFGLRKSVDEGSIDSSAIVTWPVVYNHPHAPEDPHITILYVPNINDYNKEDFIEAIIKASHDMYLVVEVEGLAWFGPDRDVPVLRVSHRYLETYRDRLKLVLKDDYGIVVEETYPTYNPHVTITERAAEGVLPRELLAAPVELWWGEEKVKING